MPRNFESQVTNRESDTSLDEHTALEAFEETCMRVESVEMALATALQSVGGVVDELQHAVTEILDWPEPNMCVRFDVTEIGEMKLVHDCVRYSPVITESLNPYSDPDVEYPPDLPLVA